VIKPAVGFRIAYEGYSVVMSGDTRLTEDVVRVGVDLVRFEIADGISVSVVLPAGGS